MLISNLSRPFNVEIPPNNAYVPSSVMRSFSYAHMFKSSFRALSCRSEDKAVVMWFKAVFVMFSFQYPHPFKPSCKSFKSDISYKPFERFSTAESLRLD